MKRMHSSFVSLAVLFCFRAPVAAAEYALFPVASPEEALASCFPCPAGTFSLDTPYCVPCPKGAYTMEEESANCIACPSGWTTRGEGSSSVWQCAFAEDGSKHPFFASSVKKKDSTMLPPPSTLQMHFSYLHVAVLSMLFKSWHMHRSLHIICA